jgi:hypothetical protein
MFRVLLFEPAAVVEFLADKVSAYFMIVSNNADAFTEIF